MQYGQCSVICIFAATKRLMMKIGKLEYLTLLNKIENLLGPLKMCLCDLVLNCYSIVVSLCCSFTFPFLPVLQCCSVMELQCFSALVLLCCKAIVLQRYCAAVLSAMVLQCYDIVLL